VVKLQLEIGQQIGFKLLFVNKKCLKLFHRVYNIYYIYYILNICLTFIELNYLHFHFLSFIAEITNICLRSKYFHFRPSEFNLPAFLQTTFYLISKIG